MKETKEFPIHVIDTVDPANPSVKKRETIYVILDYGMASLLYSFVN